ncbi:hypothetical protein [Paenibacillus sp. BC26]|uniref:hypothetical protein n=1 Tax=Paenibacillus sp. BC26 TaxID=1881032 RepID=UPI0008DF7CCD|nr:hypothetical protein [Paenibacillus sp. BC26]SFS77754.1 hypothetical protein SAMN05428962_2804 [Paenibacillus sp. BC26]
MVTTKEELKLIHDSVLLPLMLDMIEKSRQEIEQSKYSLRTLYATALNKLREMLLTDMKEHRKQLMKANIKLWKVEVETGNIKYRFKTRGFESDFELHRNMVKNDLSVKFGVYISRVSKSLSDMAQKKL